MTRIKTLEELNSIGYKEFSVLEDIIINLPQDNIVNSKATAEAWEIIKNKDNNTTSSETYGIIGGMAGFLSGAGLIGYFHITRDNAGLIEIALIVSGFAIGALCDKYVARKESRKKLMDNFWN